MRTIVGVVLLGLALTGCTGGNDKTEEYERAEKVDSSTETPGSKQDGQGASEPVQFGGQAETERGVAVAVDTPQPLELSENAVAGGEPDFVTFEVTLSNYTEKPISPADVFVTVASGDGQGGEVIDRPNGVDGPPRGKVPPGGSRSWDVGFGVMDPEDVQIQVQVGMDALPVTFAEPS